MRPFYAIAFPNLRCRAVIMAMAMESAGTAPSTYDSSIHDNHHLASTVTEDEYADSPEDNAEEELDVLREYVRSSDSIIAQSIQRYVGFVRKRKRAVDPARWTLIKSEHGLDVYKEHAEQRLMKSFVSSVGSGDGGDDEVDARQAAKDEDVRRAERTRLRGRSIGYDTRCGSSYIEYPSTMVSAFCIGKVRGSLDTVMAGLYTDNTDDMHANCAIQFGDNVVLDCGVLQAFETKSETAPYNFFGVKWLEKQGHVPGVVNQLCWVERTGIHTISSGRRFGYQLLKSIQLSDPDERVSRASSVASARPVNVSLCYLYCQIDEDVVEVFVRGIVEIVMDDSSDAGEADAVRAAGDYILAIVKGRECGRMRKIAELIGQSKTARDQLTCQQAMLRPKLVNVHELARKKHGSSENSTKPPHALPLLQSRYGTLRRDAELPETLTSYREYQSFRMFLPIRDPRPSSNYRKNQKERGNVLMQMLRKNQHRSTYLPEFLCPKDENEGEEQGATTGAAAR